VSAAGNAEQARQLGHRDREPGAGLEADQDAVAHQLDQRARPQRPCQQAQDRHRERGEARDRGVALRVARRHRAHRAGDHQRDGGGRADRKLARGAEQRVADPAQQIAVDADLRRQARERRIGERNRDRVGRERHAGNDVVA